MSAESNTNASGEASPEATLRQKIQSKFPEAPLVWSAFRGQERVVVPSGDIHSILSAFRELGMDQLCDLTAVDMLEYPEATDRFEVVYLLLNTVSGQRVIVKTHLNPPDLTLPSATGIWFGADWLEREAYDMFGIIFAGHPNMKRLLLPDAFASYPLRKDYPVKGRGERHNFPIITRAES